MKLRKMERDLSKFREKYGERRENMQSGGKWNDVT
jgi:hypothetical protein